ncbi:MAG: hypothetical protein KDH96_12280, partial [Candidatus Riesia sp.]|nr:hypothetical protein [Candidatus Riesia sp.]
MATAYKEAKDLGALVGADWELVNAIAPKFSLTGLPGDLISGKDKEAALSALRTGLKAAQADYETSINTLQMMYPDVDVKSIPSLQMNVAPTPQRHTFNMAGNQYYTAPGLSNQDLVDLQDLLSTPYGLEEAIKQGF